EDFCRGRLRTSAQVAAAFAAAACRVQQTAGPSAGGPGRPGEWALLDAEFDARTPSEATRAGPASAPVRLLGLDPFAVQAMLARLAPDIDTCGEAAALAAGQSPPSLPCDGAPAVDLLADFHLTAGVRLFAS